MGEPFISGLRPNKRLGQVFLHNRDIAAAEAAHSTGKTVLEIGPGHGILTEQLCKNAKKVIAVEKDTILCRLLRAKIRSRKLRLIEGDFLIVKDDGFGADKIDIVISNIPYNLSSSIIEWLSKERLEAVLCLQKEFVEHMLAKPGDRSYSKLSVMSSLMYRMVKIMDVSRGCFRPVPNVDSVLVYLKPKDIQIDENERFVIGLLMQHKKKTVRNAIIDSSSYLNMDKDKLRSILNGVKGNERRPFSMTPDEILSLAKELSLLLK
jgi:16S rRNA (adenine1518-N6/adenine1519-N6)-dimethyltransferase